MHFIQMEEIFFIQFILTIYKKYLNRTAEKTRFAMNNIFYFYISVNLMKKKIQAAFLFMIIRKNLFMISKYSKYLLIMNKFFL